MDSAFTCFRFPGRPTKPRTAGVTVVVDGMDSGYLGPQAQYDLLETAADCIDFVKIGWLLGALQSADALSGKIARYRAAGVEPFPGGVLIEMATVQGCVGPALEAAYSLGYRWVEVSCSLVPLSIDERTALTHQARGKGFHVLGEVGEKGPGTAVDLDVWAREVDAYVEAGADYVILESERLDAILRDGRLSEVVSGLPHQDRLIWEVPYGYPLSRVAEMAWGLVRELGTDVNLANIEPHHILGVESVRRRACFGGSFLGNAFLGSARAAKGAADTDA